MTTDCPVILGYKSIPEWCHHFMKGSMYNSFIFLELVYMAVICIENCDCEFMSSQNWKHSLRYRFTEGCKWFMYTILTETVSYHFYLLKDIRRLPLSRIITGYLQSNFRFKFCKQSSIFTHQNQISSINVTGNVLTSFHCHWRNLKHLLNRFPPRIPFVHL